MRIKLNPSDFLRKTRSAGKAKVFFKKLPRILGENAFLTFLFLLLLSLIIGGIIFYKYSILSEKVEAEIIEKPLQFKEGVYRKVLDEWEAREKRFRESELREYPDLFMID